MSLSSFMIFNLSRKLFVLMQHLRTRLTVTLDHPAVVQIATSMAAESNLVVAWRGTDRRISTPMRNRWKRQWKWLFLADPPEWSRTLREPSE